MNQSIPGRAWDKLRSTEVRQRPMELRRATARCERHVAALQPAFRCKSTKRVMVTWLYTPLKRSNPEEYLPTRHGIRRPESCWAICCCVKRSLLTPRKSTRRSIVDQPKHAEGAPRNWCERALRPKGYSKAAAPHYRKAIEIDPATAPFHYFFAFTLIRLGENGEGSDRSSRKQSVVIRSLSTRTPQLSKVLAESGKTRDAISHYEQAHRLRPGLAVPPWLVNFVPSRQ